MSHTALALVGLALLISVLHWGWAHLVPQVDLRMMSPQSRRHVRWMLANSGHIQLASGALIVLAVCVQAAS